MSVDHEGANQLNRNICNSSVLRSSRHFFPMLWNRLRPSRTRGIKPPTLEALESRTLLSGNPLHGSGPAQRIRPNLQQPLVITPNATFSQVEAGPLVTGDAPSTGGTIVSFSPDELVFVGPASPSGIAGSWPVLPVNGAMIDPPGRETEAPVAGIGNAGSGDLGGFPTGLPMPAPFFTPEFWSKSDNGTPVQILQLLRPCVT